MQPPFTSSIKRINIFYGFLVVLFAVFGIRLFHLQVLKHSFYQQQAQAAQLKQFEIPAERGNIYAYDGDEKVPLVLNEVRYRITADPKIISDPAATAQVLSPLLNRPAADIEAQLREDSRYEVLATKQTKEVKQAVEEKRLQGVFVNEKVSLRVYPQGSLASQLVGFVNDEGVGNYGIEQAMNNELTGTPGKVKALTDQNNVPLLATDDNVLTDPVDGSDIVLTIDIAMQRQLEQRLKEGLEAAKSLSGSAIIIDPSSGAVKAMANYPSYDQAQFAQVDDPALFRNAAVDSPLEPGSIMKTLTVAAALDNGSVNSDSSYYDPGFVRVDNATIVNVEEVAGAGTRTVSDILRLSLNTGAVHLLKQMGGGDLNERGRKAWHDYMVNHFMFGSVTGIEQGGEAEGIVPSPTEGFGLDIQFANTSFGQGMTATPLQMIAALSAVINGGTYYQPSLVESIISEAGGIEKTGPVVKKEGVVSSDVSSTVVSMMANVVNNNNRPAARQGYLVGGKTGTAQIAKPEGGYYEDKFNGTYVGFVGGDKPEYAVIIRVNEPGIAGYAGSRAAAPLFASVSNMLIDNFNVPRKSN
jgi:cell division protein FtsI (penicillin-binding protein 3)